MMYLGYLKFAEIEVVNEERLHTYQRAMDFPPTCQPDCTTLRTSLEHAVYTTPAADGAPWYDPAIPESGDVAGFQLLSVDGLGSTISRGFSQTSTGVSIGTINPAPRQMVLRFAALAKNECATDYAVQWLLKVLAGLNCNQPFYPNLPNRPCGGDDMCFFSCCPTGPADVATRLMSMYKVGLTGSTVIGHQEIYDCAGHMCEIEVTLAGDPYIWRNPFTALDVRVDEMTFFIPDIIDFPELCVEAECAIPSPPNCPDIFALSPEVPPTPCIGGTPIDLGLGSQQRLNMNHYVMNLDMSGVSKKLLSAPIISWQPTPDIDSDVPIMFGFSRNNCGQEQPCDVESIYFVPAYYTVEGFVLDTRLSAGYQVPDGCPIYVTDLDLSPVGWDRLSCAEDMCLHVWIDERYDSRAGQVKVQFATEYTAVC